jgi:uncharacterized protein YndB with AHSA1/START domain
MDQLSRNLNTIPNSDPSFINTPVVEVERTFQAPVERVWKAWSNQDIIRQWWGPETYTCPEAQIDFRVGGDYLIAMKGPDQKVVWAGGTYKEIIPNEKIYYTDHFCDENGKWISPSEAGLPGEWPHNTYVTVTFDSIGENETYMSISHEGIPGEMHDDCVSGWSSSIDKMQRLVERRW